MKQESNRNLALQTMQSNSTFIASNSIAQCMNYTSHIMINIYKTSSSTRERTCNPNGRAGLHGTEELRFWLSFFGSGGSSNRLLLLDTILARSL